DESIKYSVNGKVIWITPNNVHNRTPGIGVQFVGENADKLYKKITNMLDKYSSNKEPTNTM
ncbi:MAG: PilZ domain-containing protein, partial [Gammaproteobacteria bacterium]